MAPGERSDLWLGSEEGLIHFDFANETFSSFKLSDKVSSNIINFIENENGKRLWLGTDNGLFQVDLPRYYNDGQFSLRSFNQYDGIISNECNQNASYTDFDGNIWFGTNGGLLRYTHDQYAQQQISVIVHITDIQQNFESVYSRIKRDAVDPSLNTFRYNESRLTFRYSAIHFTNPDKVVYSYRLSGMDEEWSPATQENYVTYSSLPPSDYYLFEVRSRVGTGYPKTPFNFYVAPPFYLRWWFIVGIFLLTGGIIWLIFDQYQSRN